MLIVRPDHARRIDLAGAGPCPRPVDIDRSQSGFASLVSLRVYSFRAGVVIDGEAENDEVFVVLMRGKADIAVSSDGHPITDVSLAREDSIRAVYLPPHSSYRLTAATECDMAYARAEPVGAAVPRTRGFAMVAHRLDVPDHAVGMELALTTVAANEGNGSADHGRAGERFIHLRSDDAMTATIAGQRLGNWDTVALTEGETALLEVDAGIADILTISARPCASGAMGTQSGKLGVGPP